MSIWEHLNQQISQATGRPFQARDNQGVGGGCINQTTRISDGQRSYFVKINHIAHGDMFQAEAEGLAEMAAGKTLRVPEPIVYGDYQQQCYLVLEYLQLDGRIDSRMFGEQFAAMHRITQPRFGWHRNNTIGSTPQVNDWCEDWVEFWRQHRLGYQLQLAQSNGCGNRLLNLGEQLMSRMSVLFDDYHPQPSMLHGDLWTGNAAALKNGTPVIFDPAFYYGDREADLAMTELFGSFGRDFYAAYNAAWPIDAGYNVRRTFYNLYHIINHFNMFGGGYLGQAESMAERVLAEI